MPLKLNCLVLLFILLKSTHQGTGTTGHLHVCMCVHMFAPRIFHVGENRRRPSMSHFAQSGRTRGPGFCRLPLSRGTHTTSLGEKGMRARTFHTPLLGSLPTLVLIHAEAATIILLRAAKCLSKVTTLNSPQNIPLFHVLVMGLPALSQSCSAASLASLFIIFFAESKRKSSSFSPSSPPSSSSSSSSLSVRKSRSSSS